MKLKIPVPKTADMLIIMSTIFVLMLIRKNGFHIFIFLLLLKKECRVYPVAAICSSISGIYRGP